MSYVTLPNVLCDITHVNILMKSTTALKLTIFINETLFLQSATSFVITYHIFKRIYNKAMKSDNNKCLTTFYIWFYCKYV